MNLVAWFDALRADVQFGWRHIGRNAASSAAAVVSLAVAIGACTSASRSVDALLLRPLPIANAERLYSIAQKGLGPGGNFRIIESSEYPLFLLMRDAVRDSAELIAVSYADRADVTYGSDEDMEKASRQYVSGWMFREFGIRPAAGRLLTERDDETPGAHPYAVLSHDYWTRRFARAPHVVGMRIRIGDTPYEIVGVADAPFAGTETGTAVDIFVPAMMNPYVTRSDASWFRPFAALKPGVEPQRLRESLQAVSNAFQQERAKTFTDQSKQFIERFLNQTLLLEPAPSGASGLQRDYGRPLIALAVFATLVLLIACANVANLIVARTTARAKEMALRVSIGAGRSRLVQLVLMEALWLGAMSATFGNLIASAALPFLVRRINPPDNPATLFLPWDWRVLVFGAALATGVTVLLGLIPALRASSVRPVSALKGGDDPHARGRLMHGLIAMQTAFCLVVLFAAGLFVGTLNRLVHQPLGFSPERLVALEARSVRPQPAAAWDRVADHLRALPGVEAVALASFPLLSGNGSNGTVWVNGQPTEVLSYFLGVSPEWRNAMGIALLHGRDLRPGETSPSVALVNEAFVKQCFGGVDPVGKYFERGNRNGNRFQVVGAVRDARYRNLREPITPTAYIPFHAMGKGGEAQLAGSGAFLVRTAAADPRSLAATLRREVPRGWPELRVTNVRTQVELIERHTIRERLLAMLATFFAAAGLLLASVGLFGVLEYSVLQRRREIGIRLAIGAPARDIVWRVTAGVLSMIGIGICAGAALGSWLGQFAESILYGVRPDDANLLVIPALAILTATVLASAPAVLRAVRTDPASVLRPE